MTIVGTSDGRYMCRCAGCEKTFWHDNKRSVCCEDCRSRRDGGNTNPGDVATTERITAAAVKLDDDGATFHLPPPARHHDIMRELHRLVGPVIVQPDEQGFVTSEDRFVSRHAALRIARAAGQILRETAPAHGLFSEDVW